MWCAGGGSIRKRDTNRLERLFRYAGSVVGMELESVVVVAERRTLDKLLAITDAVSHPLHVSITAQRSLFSSRLLSLNCSTDRLRKSFQPRAITLYSSTLGRAGGMGHYSTTGSAMDNMLTVNA